MHRIFAAVGIAMLAGACSYVTPGPSTAYYPGSALDPECAQSTPGNSVAGFRCTGDYTGDGSGRMGR